jgi:hypothetical protein
MDKIKNITILKLFDENCVGDVYAITMTTGTMKDVIILQKLLRI